MKLLGQIKEEEADPEDDKIAGDLLKKLKKTKAKGDKKPEGGEKKSKLSKGDEKKLDKLKKMIKDSNEFEPLDEDYKDDTLKYVEKLIERGIKADCMPLEMVEWIASIVQFLFDYGYMTKDQKGFISLMSFIVKQYESQK